MNLVRVVRVVVVMLAILSAGACKKSSTTPSATRVITVFPISFTATQVGSRSTSSLSIQNSGYSTLRFTTITFSACPTMFIVPAPFDTGGSVDARTSLGFVITFAPTAVANCNGTVTVTSDATSGTNSAALTAAGI